MATASSWTSRLVRSSLVLTAILCAALAAACGDDDDGSLPAATTVAKDQAQAESLVLTLADFPSGWKQKPPKDDVPGPLDACDPGDSPGRTGLSEPPDFALGDDSVANAVALFGSKQAASASLDRIRPQADCMVAAIKSGAVDSAQLTAVDAAVEPLKVPAMGDRTEAHRVTITFKQLPSNVEVAVTIDLVFVAKGRAGFSLVAQSVLTPFDEKLLKDLAAKMEARLP